MKVICNKVRICKDITCCHHKAHDVVEYNFSTKPKDCTLSGECDNIKVKCIPIESEDARTEMNYIALDTQKRMNEKLVAILSEFVVLMANLVPRANQILQDYEKEKK